MGIIAWIVLGAIAGYLAGFLVRGDEGLGVIGHIGLGIVGALIGGFLASAVFGVDAINGVLDVGTIDGDGGRDRRRRPNGSPEPLTGRGTI
jgi:uncharacterized membrane protein YeaQ/YmgE (transglycosylase-associated protein family)